MTPGFLLLVGYGGPYVASVTSRAEVERARERYKDMLARERETAPHWKARMRAKKAERRALSVELDAAIAKAKVDGAAIPLSYPRGTSDTARAKASKAGRGLAPLPPVASHPELVGDVESALRESLG